MGGCPMSYPRLSGSLTGVSTTATETKEAGTMYMFRWFFLF